MTIDISHQVNIRCLGLQDYMTTWEAMQQFTRKRDAHTIDEIWLLEHTSVFTQGQNGKQENLLCTGDIPVVKTDRGGQVTYHGPGQLMVYTLIDLKRKQFNVRELVSSLEQSVVDLLAEFLIKSYAKRAAPGVYVDEKKICSIGLRIQRGCTYHGIAFNIAMDLEPFTRIHPCGFSHLEMTQFKDLGGLNSTLETGKKLVNYLMKNLVYTDPKYIV